MTITTIDKIIALADEYVDDCCDQMLGTDTSGRFEKSRKALCATIAEFIADLDALKAELSKHNESLGDRLLNLCRAFEESNRIDAENEIKRLQKENNNLLINAARDRADREALLQLNDRFAKRNLSDMERMFELEQERDALRMALHEIAEEWAGAECGVPVGAREAYAIGLVKRMYSIAIDAARSKT